MNTRKIIKNIVKNLLLEALSVDPGEDTMYNIMRSDAQEALSKELATVKKPEPPPKRDPKKPPADPAELEKAKRDVIAADPNADKEALKQRNLESWNRIQDKYMKALDNIQDEYDKLLKTPDLSEETATAARKNKQKKEEDIYAALDRWKTLLEI